MLTNYSGNLSNDDKYIIVKETETKSEPLNKGNNKIINKHSKNDLLVSL